MSSSDIVEFDVIYLLEKFAPTEEFTPLQVAAITHYLTNGFNKTQAVISAGYSPNGASVQGSRLFGLSKTKAVIQGYFSLLSMSRSELIGRLAEQARNEGAYHLERNDKDTLKNLREAGLLHLVKKYRQTAHGWSIEFVDPQKALTLLGKELGAWNADASEAPTINIDRFEQDINLIFENGKDKSVISKEYIDAEDPPRLQLVAPELVGSGNLDEAKVINAVLSDPEPVNPGRKEGEREGEEAQEKK